MSLDWSYLIVYALLSGAAITLAVGLSRRVGVWGGVLAAAPVTPTFAVLIFSGSGRPPDLTGGVPVILATVIVLAGLAGLVHATDRDRTKKGLAVLGRLPFGVYLVSIVPFLAWSIARWVPQYVLLPGLVAAACVAGYRMRMIPRAAVRRDGHVMDGAGLRFVLGGVSVLAVALAARFLPSAAAAVALFPLVFTAGVILSQVDGGRFQAAKVMAGGVSGSMGVAAFVVVVASLVASGVQGAVWLLVAGWAGYAVVSVSWLTATWLIQMAVARKKGKGPVSSPGLQVGGRSQGPGWGLAPSHD